MDEAAATHWSESGVTVSPESQEDSVTQESILAEEPPKSTGEEKQQQQVHHFSQNKKDVDETTTPKRKAAEEQEVIDLIDSADEEDEEKPKAAKHPRTTDDPNAQPQHKLPDWMAARPEANRIAERAHYIPFPSNFVPDWKNLLPPRAYLSPTTHQINQYTPVAFELALLNVKDFTIEAIDQYGNRSTQLPGLRKPIRQICAQHHVKAVKDMNKWRIPLNAYQDVFIFLSHKYRVEGIPPTQLQIAALERERQEKEYPDTGTLESYGVPNLIAQTLAPFQRGGVDFVREKNGRALIADELRNMLIGR